IMRKLLRKIHRYLGLTLGLIISVIGLTGSLYVFQPELTSLFYSDLYRVRNGNSGADYNTADVIRSAETKFGKKIRMLQFPERELETFVLQLEKDKRWHFFDPYTAEYLGSMDERRGAFDIILKAHRTLFMEETGKYINAVSVIFFALFIISSGVYMWYPKNRNWSKAFRIRTKEKGRKFNHDLHKVSGIVFTIPLLIAAITGLFFTFPEFYRNTLSFITGEEAKAKRDKNILSAPSNGEALDVYAAFKIMDNNFKNYKKRRLTMPKSGKGTIYLSYTDAEGIPAGPRKRPYMYIDQYSGKSVEIYDPAKTNITDSILNNWFAALHFGEAGGIAMRIVLFFAGLMPVTLYITGIKIWLKPKKKHKELNLPKEKKTVYI
ncbi:MAG TPA: PepSY-associated TM helix domain-containing protein, partial [Ignavibacteriales bacterium]|nr:PepSY-associated TM helix domain-containing protein [Ignavibacteriales bacterium]